MRIIANFLDKQAAFPAQFTKLDKSTKNSISKYYDVGPKSGQKEINPSDASKKPYNSQLLLYTLKTYTQQDQIKMRDEIYDIDKELRNDPKYTELVGSKAGRDYEEKFRNKRITEIHKKYKENEYPVAWGIGTSFTVNHKMFSYGYSRRKSYSTAPDTRKQLIDLMQEKGGKVYVITPDPDLEAKRKTRRDLKPNEDDQLRQQVQERAKKYVEAKKKDVLNLVDKYVSDIQKQIIKNLNDLPEQIKKGGYSGASRLQKTLMQDVDVTFIDKISKILYQLDEYEKGYIRYDGWNSPQKDLINFTKKLNSIMSELK